MPTHLISLNSAVTSSRKPSHPTLHRATTHLEGCCEKQVTSSTVAWSSGSGSLCPPNSTLSTLFLYQLHPPCRPCEGPKGKTCLNHLSILSKESRTTHLYMCVYAQSLSCVWLSVAPWTIDCPAPLSMRCSRQEYQSRLPTPGNLPDPGTEPMSFPSPPLAGRIFTSNTPIYLHGKGQRNVGQEDEQIDRYRWMMREWKSNVHFV